MPKAKPRIGERFKEEINEESGSQVSEPLVVPSFDPTQYIPPDPVEHSERPIEPEERSAGFIPYHSAENGVQTKLSLAEDARLLENFFKSVTSRGREVVLIEALANHPDNFDSGKDRKWERLAAALVAPEFRDVSFSQICHRLRIPWRDVIVYFMDYQRSMAMYEVASYAPSVAQRTLEDSLPRDVVCEYCEGEGKVWKAAMDENGDIIKEGKKTIRHRVECRQCKGTGIGQLPPDKDARKLSLEMAGLVKNPAAVVIQQNFGMAVEDNVREVGDVLKEDAREIEKVG